MKDGTNRKTKILTVSVPVSLLEQLDRIVYFNFLNKSSLVSAAIAEYLERYYDYFPNVEKEDPKNG